MHAPPTGFERRSALAVQLVLPAEECRELARGLHVPGAGAELLEYARLLEVEAVGVAARTASRQRRSIDWRANPAAMTMSANAAAFAHLAPASNRISRRAATGCRVGDRSPMVEGSGRKCIA